jgi:outer membrane protein TolC
MRSLIGLAVLVIPALLSAQQAPLAAEELTLEQAVSLALKDNRNIANARLGIERSENDIAIARTYRLPSFSLDVYEGQLFAPIKFEIPAGALGVYPATGPIPGAQEPITTPARPFTLVEARATQPLSRLHGITLGIQLRQLEREEADAKLKEQQLSLVNQVRRLYYGILETQSALAANQSSQETLREQDRVAMESVARQTALQSEELDVKARIAKVEYESATLQHDLASQKEALNDLLGRDPRLQYTVRGLPDVSPETPDLAAARARALAERPEIREAKLRVQEAKTDHDMKKVEFIPEVNFNISYLSPFRLNFLPENIGTAGFTLKWDVFDWGRKKKELANKTIVIDQAGIALRSTEVQVAAEVELQYRKVEDSQHLLDVVKAAQNAARERVRIATERHALDAALLRDLLEAQSSLAETDHQYQQALVSYMSARADFDKVTAAQ